MYICIHYQVKSNDKNENSIEPWLVAIRVVLVGWCEEALLRCFDMGNLTLHLSPLTPIEGDVLFTFDKIKKHFNSNVH